MPAVLVTHADEPIGRRLVKRLFHDPDVEYLLAVGDGPAPRSFARFLAECPPRMSYVRVDVARSRPASDLFNSQVRDAAIDTLVHLPRHGAGAAEGPPIVSGLPVRTAEARIVLRRALESDSIQTVVSVGSAFVYKLAPGNANRLAEDSELDLDPATPPEVRSWVDCDLLFRGELTQPRLRIVLLRVPTIVASGGSVYLNPALEGTSLPRFRPLGFDPLCALISDHDVARGVQAAIHRPVRGVLNLAGDDLLPLSVLARWTGRYALPVPGVLLRALAAAASATRLGAIGDGPWLRYGFTLDTSRAARELGFEPAYRVGLARSGDGRLRVETSPA